MIDALSAVDWLVKASLIAGLGLLASQVLVGRTASARHWTLAVTLAGLLVLPAAALALPALELAWLPEVADSFRATETVAGESGGVEGTPGRAAPAPAPGVPAARRAAPVRIPWGLLIAGVYVFVAGLLLLRLFVGILRLARMTRRGTALDEALWRPLLRDVKTRRPLRVVTSPAAAVPMTWGILRPVILLPQDALDWTPDERRQALLHEAAHIERADWPVQLLARIACALYWFHPLVWLAGRRLYLEAERACDDRVLLAGARSTDYAEQLLELARNLGGRARSFEAVTMARRGQLWKRIDSVLGNTPRRCPMTRTRRLSVALVALIALLLVAPLTLTPAGSHDETNVDLDRLERLLEGEKLNPLMQAVMRGDWTGASRLLDAGADPNAGVAGRGTPLIVASARGDASMVELLLQSGADPNRADEQIRRSDVLLRTPLGNAARIGHAGIVRRLLDAGARVDFHGAGDATALMEASAAGHTDVVDLLIQREADVNLAVGGDGTALITAAGAGHADVVERLLAEGADPNRAVRGDGNPLIAAARSGDEETVELLLAAGADPGAFVSGDETPLFHAVRSGNPDLVRRLIEAGVDVNAEIPGDGSALIVAAKTGNHEIVDLLVDAGARPDDGYDGDGNALITAASNGDYEMVERFITRGADVNAGVIGDGNPLIMAAAAGHLDVVQLLVRSGAEIDRVVPGDENALIRASEGGHRDVVLYLLEQGADVNMRVRANGEVRTALRMALRGGYDDVVKLLRSWGAAE